MKNTVKKVMAGVMAAAMMFSAAPMAEFVPAVHFGITASALENTLETSGKCGENLTWVLDDKGTVTISGEGKMFDYKIIPNDDNIIKSNSPFSDRSDIKKIIIEDGVTGLGSYAFFRCTELTEIDIPDSVESFGSLPIYDCDKLTSVYIPEKVDDIYIYSFYDCDGLQSIIVNEKNENYCIVDKGLYTKDKTTFLAYPLGSDDVNIYLPEECIEFSSYVLTAYDRIRNNNKLEIRPLKKEYNIYSTETSGNQLYGLLYGYYEAAPPYYCKHYYSACENDYYYFFQSYALGRASFFAEWYAIYNNTYYDWAESINSDPNSKIESCYNRLYELYKEKRSQYEDAYSIYADPEIQAAYLEYEEAIIEEVENSEYFKYNDENKDAYDVMQFMLENRKDVVLPFDNVSVKVPSEDIYAGDNAIFTAEVEMPEVEYTWYVNGEIAGTDESLTINNTEEGEYRIKVTAVYPNGHTSESEEITVNVKKMTAKDKIDDIFKGFNDTIDKIIKYILAFFRSMMK